MRREDIMKADLLSEIVLISSGLAILVSLLNGISRCPHRCIADLGELFPAGDRLDFKIFSISWHCFHSFSTQRFDCQCHLKRPPRDAVGFTG